MFVYYFNGTSCFTRWAEERRKVNVDSGCASGSPDCEIEKWCILKMKTEIFMKALGLNPGFVSEVPESL